MSELFQSRLPKSSTESPAPKAALGTNRRISDIDIFRENSRNQLTVSNLYIDNQILLNASFGPHFFQNLTFFIVLIKKFLENRRNFIKIAPLELFMYIYFHGLF